MSKIRLIFRLYAQGMSKHQMAERSGTSRNTLKKYLATYAGSEVGRYVEGVLRTRPHPEQAYKACMGILSWAKKVGEMRLIAACKRGNSYVRYTYSTIQRILDLGLDARDADGELQEESRPMPGHSNIRGGAYYE